MRPSSRAGKGSAADEKFSGKIQSIYNGKCAPITMQGLARARENPPAQEQWKTMEKTMRRTIGTVGNPGEHMRPVGRRQAGEGAARESPPSGPNLFEGLRMSLGAQLPD